MLAECRRLGVAVASLETCFLPTPDRFDAAALRAAAGEIELVLAWGHPDGLELGTRPDRLDELLAWIEVAPAIGGRLVRLVAGSPRFRARGELDGTHRALVEACRAGAAAGVELALENHADLTAAEIGELIDRVHSPVLGVCLDTANALRVGDDPLAAARALGRSIRMVHLKDCHSSKSDLPGGPRSVAYGEGIVPLEPILDVLAAAGFRGPVCVEFGHLGPGELDELALVERSIAWLRPRLERYGRR